MKTNFTFKINCLALVIFSLISTLNLKGQSVTNVSVTSFAFSPSQVTITAGEKVVWTNNSGSHNVNGTTATFPGNPESFGNNVGSGWTYEFTFNTPGTYDYQCDPHASFGMVGKVIVNPIQSTGTYTATVNFTGMTPHIGENIWLAVINQATKAEIGRIKKNVTAANFSIDVSGIESGKSYNIDFYADHNKNGVYDAPPVDHSWRLQLNNVTGNSTLNFAHNTTFTDILWKNKLTLHFTGMTPHLGEKIVLYLKQTDTGLYKDTVTVSQIAAVNFDMNSFKIKPGISYNLDFYADHNKNGVYDAPPIDHAWRILLNSVKGDTIINFAHNTTFTDIFPKVTAIQSLTNVYNQITLFPNPAREYIQISVPSNNVSNKLLKVYSATGARIDERSFSGNQESIRYNVSQLKNGVYFIEIGSPTQTKTFKLIKY